MKERTGRNDPCPCGSGKKYKKCCLAKDSEGVSNETKTIYRFESGSYGGSGRFFPSLACLKQTGREGKWRYHFLLVKPESLHADEDKAVAEAERDMSKADEIKQATGSEAKMAMELRRKGYLNVEDYKIVGQDKLRA